MPIKPGKPQKSKENERIRRIFATLASANPDPKTELISTNPFTLLVAIILSAQATDASVNKATAALFKKVRTPKEMAALGEEGLIPYIKTIGLFRAKAKNVIAMARMLLDEFAGEVPHTREALMRLPGVGRKTANVWLNCVLGEPTMAVDTHVFRVSHRLGLAKGATPEAVEQELLACVPQEFMQHAHHWLILHGRYICVARNPRCAECIISAYCPSAFLLSSKTAV